MPIEEPVSAYMSVQLQLLDACNLRCSHCYDERDARRPMPAYEEIRRRIDAIYAFGRSHGFEPDLHLSGGEPTLRPDIVDIVRHIVQERGGDALLFTNGTRWSPALARALYAAGLRYVQVSLEGAEEVNDAVRGSGVFREAMGTLRMLREEGFRRTISLTVTARNFPSLRELVAEHDALDVHFHLREVLPLGRGVGEAGLTRDARRALSEWAIGWRGTSSVGVEDPVHCSVSPSYARTRRGCVAGRNHFCVEVDGSVQPCRPLGIRVGCVDDLASAWFSPTLVRMRERRYGGRCGRCDLRLHCGGCRVHPWLRGDPFGEDDRCFADEHDLVRTPFEAAALRAAERFGRGIYRARRVGRRLGSALRR